MKKALRNKSLPGSKLSCKLIALPPMDKKSESTLSLVLTYHYPLFQRNLKCCWMQAKYLPISTQCLDLERPWRRWCIANWLSVYPVTSGPGQNILQIFVEWHFHKMWCPNRGHIEYVEEALFQQILGSWYRSYSKHTLLI